VEPEADINGRDDFTLSVEVEIIDDPAVISQCCASTLSQHKLLVCSSCRDYDAGIAAIIIFPIEQKRGHPFCAACLRTFSIWNQA